MNVLLQEAAESPIIGGDVAPVVLLGSLLITAVWLYYIYDPDSSGIGGGR